MSRKIAVTFVHGYNNLDLNITGDNRPALWFIDDCKENIYSYPFPRTPSDFTNMVGDYIVGELPKNDIFDFKSLPRFGFTGLSLVGNALVAGSWNALYIIDYNNGALKKIISHSLMNDMHGIYADSEVLISILTGKDAIVITDWDGKLVDHFTIGNDLSVYKDINLECHDWRFLSKQYRGATGYWHFNYVNKQNNELWLTSRNGSCFVIVNLQKKTAKLGLINHMTPVLLHDGKKHKHDRYLTSVDGKIIITQNAKTANYNSQESSDNIELFNRDYVCKVIRLDETELDREPNWCRGIDVIDNSIYVTIDGRYGSDLSFGLAEIINEKEVGLYKKLCWKDIGDEKELRFVTGFDICLI